MAVLTGCMVTKKSKYSCHRFLPYHVPVLDEVHGLKGFLAGGLFDGRYFGSERIL